MVKKIFNKLTKVGKWMDKGVIHRTIENINGDPECSWVFLTTVLLLGCFGIGLCLVLPHDKGRDAHLGNYLRFGYYSFLRLGNSQMYYSHV